MCFLESRDFNDGDPHPWRNAGDLRGVLVYFAYSDAGFLSRLARTPNFEMILANQQGRRAPPPPFCFAYSGRGFQSGARLPPFFAAQMLHITWRGLLLTICSM